MLLFVCTMILYRYMELLKTDVHNLSDNIWEILAQFLFA